LALFIHKVMQKENPLSKQSALKAEIKHTSPNEIIIALFRHLMSKDTFEQFFTKFLAERLLKRKSESREKELEFVGLIKAECGTQFMSKVEQMYSDIDTSVE
jgi:Cullin family